MQLFNSTYIRTKKELAIFLEVDYGKLLFCAFGLKGNSKYKTFSIKKRKGGVRKIAAPVKVLKEIQTKSN